MVMRGILPTFEQFSTTRSLFGATYSPDSTTIYYRADTSGQYNLWSVPTGGGFAKQLSGLTDWRILDFRLSPDGTCLAFIADRDGDEMFQVGMLPSSGGWPTFLTTDASAQYNLGDWLPDNQTLFITGNDRDPSEQDAQLLNIITGERTRLMTGGRNYATHVSADGRYGLILEPIQNTDQNIHLYDFGDQSTTLLTPHQGEAIFIPVAWSKSSRAFYVLTNQGHDFTNLALYDLESRTYEYLHDESHDVEAAVLSGDGKVLAAILNQGGLSQVKRFETLSHEALPTPPLPPSIVEQGGLDLSHDGTKLACLLGAATHAANLYEIDFEKGMSKALEQSMLGGIDPSTMMEPELISYSSFDREIPAWLYRPRRSAPCPVVVSIHGGPEAQERPDYAYAGLYQYLLSRGIGVLAPNIRGSTGYGVSYQKLIHRDWGGDELKDIGAAAEYLQSLLWVDGTKLAIFGESYGGFATLSAMTRLPAYWATGVDVVGQSNLVTFVQSVPPFWQRMMKAWVGDPVEDRDMLIERSPMTYIDQLRAPLLIIQGANDPRVNRAESEQLVEALTRRGIDVTYYLDEKGGHGASTREDSKKWYKMIAEYLAEKLL